MPLTLDQLLEDVTKEVLREQLLLALQGVGYVKKTGYGTGSMSVAGVAAGNYGVRFRIIAGGELGVATYQLSTDSGLTYGSTTTIPGSGIVVVGTTGATATFEAGPVGAGESFGALDTYSFELTVPNFNATDWHAGSTPLTLVEKDAEANEDFAATIKNIAKGGLLNTAEDDWLDLLLYNVYGTTRDSGEATQGTVRLSDLASGGPFTIIPGQLWVGTSLGLRYTNMTGGTLTLGGTLDLPFRAEANGAQYNVGNGSINQLFTSLPGVGVANPGPGSGVTWITTQGRNRETDQEARARAMLKWPALSVGAVEDSYKLWATEASDNVTRTKVRASPTVAGQVDVYLAGPGGPVDGATVTAVEDYIAPRVPLTSVSNVQSATGVPVSVTATVYVAAGFSASVGVGVAQNLSALAQGGLNTNLERLEGIPIGGAVYMTALIEQMMLPAGVRNVVMTLPAADVVLDVDEVATFTQAITIVEV